MDGQDLAANTQAMVTDAKEVTNYVGEYSNKNNEMYKHIDEISKVDWKGSDGGVYASKVISKKGNLTEIVGILNSYSEGLTTSAREMNNTQDEILGKIGNL